MAIIEDVEVQIVSTAIGLALTEYDNPDPNATIETGKVERYIRADTDEEFFILVKLRKGFDYHGADGIDIHYSLDASLNRHKTYTIRGSKVKIDDKWKLIHYSFGSVDVDEDTHTEKSTLDLVCNTLGNIEVCVERVRQKGTSAAPHSGFLGGRSEKVDKKLLIKSISHTFKPSTESETSAPTQRFGATPIAGKHGKRLTFNFRYRSHLGLQTLGCIQRTPSPIPVSERAPADLTEQEKIEELTRMRAEIQGLRDENITPMHVNQEANTQIDEVKDIKAKLPASVGGGSSDHMKPLKREHVREEGRGTGLGSQSTPASQKVKRQKIYDLTGDDRVA